MNLKRNQIGDNGAELMARHNSFPLVEKLNLSYNCIGNIGAEAIVTNKAFSMATNMNLIYNQIGDIGKEALVEHPCKRIFDGWQSDEYRFESV